MTYERTAPDRKGETVGCAIFFGQTINPSTRHLKDTKSFNKLIKQRKLMIESLFTESKGSHRLDRARVYVQIQVYLIALVPNLKRILLPPKPKNRSWTPSE